MLLGGLWHGASWQFIIWGGLNGIGLVVYKASAENQSVGKIQQCLGEYLENNSDFLFHHVYPCVF